MQRQSLPDHSAKALARFLQNSGGISCVHEHIMDPRKLLLMLFDLLTSHYDINIRFSGYEIASWRLSIGYR